VDIVFRGREEGYDVQSDFLDGRTSVLIHIGGLLNNGITSSALTLLHNIDYERFDVSVTFPHPTSRDLLRLAGLIDPRARQLPRIGGINGGKFQVKRLVAVKGRSASQHQAGLARYRDLMRDEWRRCFGQSVFDHVVDFSGYAPFWVKLFASRSGGSFSIWLHNDMASEVANPGRIDHLRASVAGVIALYGEADRLVSVSEALNEVNQGHFAGQVPPGRFTFARNLINYERIYHLAYGRTPGMPVATHVESPTGDTADLPGWVGALMQEYGVQNVMDEVARRATRARLVPQTPGLRTFVSVGRLSTEKNHQRLIRAFDLVHEEFPETRLVILGDGRLRPQLERLVEELGLAAVVRLGGYQTNPYVVVGDSDCFVLSSDYEGQPMVLLEALTLGRPVVTTSFASVHGALPEGTGMVVSRDKEALVEGMRAFLHGEVPAPRFDPVAYNSEAMDEFYRAIGAVAAPGSLARPKGFEPPTS
jgi:glycosyltransferase involved in cell wall biosynthesis